MPGGLNGLEHSREELAVVRVREVDDLLAAADKFECDPVSLVGLVQEVGRDPELWKLSVKHYHSLL